MNIIVNDVELNLITGIAVKNGQKINIRAKTLLVLNYLINNRESIVAKSTLLDEIWHNVVVQDQVLVQSIKEIRDLLGSQVIRTFSRQGYQWVATFTLISENDKAPNVSPTSWWNNRVLLLVFCMVIIGVALLVVKFKPATQSQNITVAFLPVINDMPDNIHGWVPLEGMNYLNQTVPNVSSFTSLAPEKILAQLPRSASVLNDKDILELQQKLGSYLVVKTRLLGYPQDFQLRYTFYHENLVEKGVIFADSVSHLLNQLVDKIRQRFMPNEQEKRANIPYKSTFSDEAFSRGMMLFEQRKFGEAKALFTSALSANNQLLVARRYIAVCDINAGLIDQGLELMLEHIHIANQEGAYREEIRSYLMIGALLINTPNNAITSTAQQAQATQYLEKSLQLALAHKEQLFIAYIYEELAVVKRQQKRYSEATILLNKAIAIHKSFRGDYGQSNALIQLAIIATKETDFILANDYLEQASVIAHKNGAVTNKVMVLLAKADFYQQQRQVKKAKKAADSAMLLAQKVNNRKLITEITRWHTQQKRYEIN